MTHCHSDEIWKDVVGYEGIYEVSNHGQVRTKKGKTTYSDLHGTRVWKQRILKEKNPNGRDVRVSLWKNKKDISYLVHQLVAKAFIDNPENHYCINHIDGNPRNNHVSNLEWCDHHHNNNHAFDNGLMSANKTMLINIETSKEHTFRSMKKASEFLKRNPGYISQLIINKQRFATCSNGQTYAVFAIRRNSGGTLERYSRL